MSLIITPISFNQTDDKTKRMKYYIIAGEASGDLHGGNFIRELVKKDPDAQIRAWGGEKMESAGAVLVKHYRDLAFMGFIEVVLNIKTILKNIAFCKKDIEEFAPDVLIFIDYPGFNMRIAKWAKKLNYKTVYYISPQIWAWKQSRVHTIKRTIDHMYVILPFEKEFYARFDYSVTFVGHPLLDEVERYEKGRAKLSQEVKTAVNSKSPVLALLPGSRKQEITTLLPLMIKAVEQFKAYTIVVAGAPSQNPEIYEQFINNKDIRLVTGKTYELLSQSTAALVTSGTATLETALFNVPQVVCYKGSFISYHIAKRLVKVDYISLVNLVMNKESVVELIQNRCRPDVIRTELLKILPEGEKRENVLSDYQLLREKLGGGGASANIAGALLKTL